MATKHIMFQRHWQNHNAGETASLDTKIADKLILEGVATLADIPGALASQAPAAFVQASSDGAVQAALQEQGHRFQIHVDDVHAQYRDERGRFETEVAALRQNLITTEEKLSAALSKKPDVRAKFKCTGKAKSETDPSAIAVDFMASVDTGNDNIDWSKFTPSGLLSMNITNPPAADKFEIGKDYYLDFTKSA